MVNDLSLKLYGKYCTAKNKIKSMLEEEHGMETIETVILILVAVIVAGILINFLTKEGFKRADDSKPCGLVEYIFSVISDKLSKTFSGSSST